MRLFIALDLPEDLRGWVKDRQEDLKRFLPPVGMRWTPGEQWHVTLRFLGESSESQAAAAVAAMKEAVEGMPAFAMSLGKLGTFSGPRMGVLWVGVEMGAEPLARLAARLNDQLEAKGFPKETRPLRGHVTLARSRTKIPSTLLRKFPPAHPSPEALIDRLHLYQSVLSSEGARYTRLHSVVF